MTKRFKVLLVIICFISKTSRLVSDIIDSMNTKIKISKYQLLLAQLKPVRW